MTKIFNLHYVQQSEDGTETIYDCQYSAISFHDAYSQLVKDVRSTGNAVICCEITL